MKKILAITLTLIMLSGLAACGSDAAVSPDGLEIEYGGEPVQKLSLVNGTENVVLTLCVSPEDYEGDISWSSSDGGVIRVNPSDDGKTAELNILKSGNAKITASAGESSASVKITVTKNPDMLSLSETACTVNGERYSSELLNIYYVKVFESFLQYYGDYVSYFGIDVSNGAKGLENQASDYSEDGTWRGAFIEYMLDEFQSTRMLCDYAEKNGIGISDEEAEALENSINELYEAAENSEYDTVGEYLESLYGTGVTEEIYLSYLNETALANSAYYSYYSALTFSDEELEEAYAELGYEDSNDYALTSMRHILIMAEADEDGGYSDEAVSAARAKAEEIYESWLSGDATEDSFALLAGEYSDDTGSSQSGGLYENIYKGEMVDGINDWLFSDERAAGDTAIIDNSGSYTGTHIVYFVGTGEIYWKYLAQQSLLSDYVDNWLTEMSEDYVIEEGADMASVGIFD